MTYPASPHQEKTIVELFMQDSIQISHRLGNLHEKYKSLSSWLTQSPLTFDAESIETLSSFFSDFLDERTREMLLDQSLLYAADSDPSDRLFTAFKMRVFVIESIDTVLDPLLKKMELTQGLISFFQHHKNLSSTIEEIPKPSVLKKTKKRQFARIREEQHRQAASASSSQQSSDLTDGAKKQVRWGHKMYKQPSHLKKEGASKESTLGSCFSQCLALYPKADKLRMDVMFKALNQSITEAEAAWRWACMRQALPELQSMVAGITQTLSPREEIPLHIECSFSEISPIATPNESEEEDEDHSFEIESFEDPSPSGLPSTDEEAPSVSTDLEKLKSFCLVIDYLDSEKIRTLVETLSSTMQHDFQRRMARHYEKYRKNQTRPDRSWAKKHSFDPERRTTLKAVLQAMLESNTP